MQFAFNSQGSHAGSAPGATGDTFTRMSAAARDMLSQLPPDATGTAAVARQQLQGALEMDRSTPSGQLVAQVVVLEGMKSCVSIMGEDHAAAQRELGAARENGAPSTMQARASLARQERAAEFAESAYRGQLGALFAAHPEVRQTLESTAGRLTSSESVGAALEQVQLQTLDEAAALAQPGDAQAKQNLDRVRASITRQDSGEIVYRGSATQPNTAGHLTLTEQTAAVAAALDPRSAQMAKQISPTITEAQARVAKTAGPGAQSVGVAVLTHPEVNLLHTDGSKDYMHRIHGQIGDGKIMMLPASGIQGTLAMQKAGHLDPSIVHEMVHATQPITGELAPANMALHEGVTESLARRIVAQDSAAFQGHQVPDSGVYDEYTAYMNELVAQHASDPARQTELLARMSREDAGVKVGKLGEILGSRALTEGQQKDVLALVDRDLVRAQGPDQARASAREMAYRLQGMQIPQLSGYDTEAEQAPGQALDGSYGGLPIG